MSDIPLACQIFFQPELVGRDICGLQYVTLGCFNAWSPDGARDNDLMAAHRAELLKNIVLAGESTFLLALALALTAA